MRARLLTLPAALLLALPLTACSDDSSSTADDPNANRDLETTDCTYTEDGMPAAKEVEPPSSEAVAEGEIAATMTTSIGEFGLTLDAAAAPCTVHSFVSLAEQGWFDDTQCHRIATSISILQCGDPTATGCGGPGYSFADELTSEETYTAGTLAMANSGAGHQRLPVLHRVRRRRAPAPTTPCSAVSTTPPWRPSPRPPRPAPTTRTLRETARPSPRSRSSPRRSSDYNGNLTPVSSSEAAQSALASSGSLASALRPTCTGQP